MENSDLPQGHLSGHSDDGNSSDDRIPDRSRLEKALVKSSIWKKQTLGGIEKRRAVAENETSASSRLSEQLVERNGEIEHLQQELERRRADLERLQAAYNQFEKESDNLLLELSEQNERLRDECRMQNSRSLLK